MGLSTSGIFSGINTADIVSKLMQVERQPLIKLQAKEADYQARISGLGKLLSMITSLKTSVTALKDSKLVGTKATSGDVNIFTATTATGASAANHSIKVNNIAAAQSIYSTTFANTTDAVADLSVVGTQKLKIQVGSGTAFTITIDSANNTLSGVKDAINNAKTDVSAAIVNDGTGNRLVLTSNKTGAANKIVVTVDEDNNGTFEEAAETDNAGLSRLAFNATYDGSGNVTGGIANMTQSLAAKDASLIVDGLAVTKDSNTITDVIEGVTITLKKDSGGSTISLNIEKDFEGVKAKISSFVTSYNGVMNSIKASGSLSSDSTIRSLRSTLKSAISETYGDSSLTLLGVTHDKAGVLSFDAATFDKEVAADEQKAVATLNAMGTALETMLNTYEKTAIPEKQKSYESIAKRLAKREEDLIRKLDKTEEEFKKKFNNLDRLMAQLQGRSTYLAQQFTALNNSSQK